MALIHCPECNLEVSDRARGCPRCAYPISRLTNLFDAAAKKNHRMLGDLIKCGADVNSSNKDGQTPLMIAVNKGDVDGVQILLLAGADPKPALDLARRKGRHEVIELLQPAMAPASTVLETPVDLPDTPPVQEKKSISTGDIQCLHCGGSIDAADVSCPHCRTLIVRRYCYKCSKLLPAHVERCPYCRAIGQGRFRYIRHLEKYVLAVVTIACVSLLFFTTRDNAKTVIRRTTTTRANGATPPPPLPQAQKKSSQPSIFPKTTASKSEQVEAIQRKEAPPTRDAGAMQPQLPKALAQNRMPLPVSRPPNIGSVQNSETSEPLETSPVPAGLPADVNDNNPEPEIKQSEAPLASSTEFEPQKPETSDPEQAVEKPASQAPQELKESGPPDRQQAQSLARLGTRLMGQRKYRQAAVILSDAVRSFPHDDPEYPKTLYNLGKTLRLSGRPDLAIPVLKKALQIRQEKNIYQELQSAKRETGDPDAWGVHQ